MLSLGYMAGGRWVGKAPSQSVPTAEGAQGSRLAAALCGPGHLRNTPTLPQSSPDSPERRTDHLGLELGTMKVWGATEGYLGFSEVERSKRGITATPWLSLATFNFLYFPLSETALVMCSLGVSLYL